MWSAVADALKWPSIVSGVLIALYFVVWFIQRGGTAKDDLKEAKSQAKLQSKVAEVKRAHPKTPRALADSLKRRLR